MSDRAALCVKLGDRLLYVPRTALATASAGDATACADSDDGSANESDASAPPDPAKDSLALADAAAAADASAAGCEPREALQPEESATQSSNIAQTLEFLSIEVKMRRQILLNELLRIYAISPTLLSGETHSYFALQINDQLWLGTRYEGVPKQWAHLASVPLQLYVNLMSENPRRKGLSLLRTICKLLSLFRLISCSSVRQQCRFSATLEKLCFGSSAAAINRFVNNHGQPTFFCSNELEKLVKECSLQVHKPFTGHLPLDFYRLLASDS